jgi:hypothetical protein
MTRDLPTSCTVPRPSTRPRTPKIFLTEVKFKKITLKRNFHLSGALEANTSTTRLAWLHYSRNIISIVKLLTTDSVHTVILQSR